MLASTDIPYGYAHCFATKEQCGRCESCLRSIVARMATEDLSPVMCVNPLYINKVAEGLACEYYREERTVKMAYGFIHMFDDVPEKKAREARARIQGMYTSRMTYFRSRRGERAIPPDEQEHIARIFRKLGIEGEPKFDRYEESIVW